MTVTQSTPPKRDRSIPASTTAKPGPGGISARPSGINSRVFSTEPTLTTVTDKTAPPSSTVTANSKESWRAHLPDTKLRPWHLIMLTFSEMPRSWAGDSFATGLAESRWYGVLILESDPLLAQRDCDLRLVRVGWFYRFGAGICRRLRPRDPYRYWHECFVQRPA